MSTLRCLDGTADGPADGSPCPNWLSSESDCPAIPRCEDYNECTSCAETDDCAWCASEQRCMTVSDAFTMDCRGTVFDPPCPSSFTREDRVVGNLAIDADPMFGGGHLLAAGLSTDGEAFELILNALNPFEALLGSSIA